MFKTIKNNIDIREILRFIVGGGSAVFVDFSVYIFLNSNHLSVWISKLVSYILGAIVGFIINKYWTFDSLKFKVSEIYRYIILYVFSAVINTVVNKSVLYFSGAILAFLIATGVSTIINYLGQKFYVFNKYIGGE